MKLIKNNEFKSIKGKIIKASSIVMSGLALCTTFGCTKKITREDLKSITDNYETIEEIIKNNPSYTEALVTYQNDNERYERYSDNGINYKNNHNRKSAWVKIDDNTKTDCQTRRINNRFLFYKIDELGLIESAYFDSIEEAIANEYYYYYPNEFVATVVTYDDKNKEYFDEDVVDISGYNEDTKTYTYHR